MSQTPSGDNRQRCGPRIMAANQLFTGSCLYRDGIVGLCVGTLDLPERDKLGEGERENRVSTKKELTKTIWHTLEY